MVRMNVATNNSVLAELQYVLAKAGQGALPRTASTLNAGANFVQGKWREFAMGGELQGVEKLKNPSNGYARSIKVKKLSPFNYEIYSEAAIAERIEKGTPELDMKKTHPFGPRSRVSEKTGYSYLIVPMRWSTPKATGFKNIMPESVYSIVKSFKKMQTDVSADNSSIKTKNARGQMVGRAQYNKGYSRLRGMDIAGTIEQKTRMSGMVRSTDDTGKNRSGGYFTFRIISANPNSKSFQKNAWVRPEQPARNVTKSLADYSQRFIEETVEAAIMEDLGL